MSEISLTNRPGDQVNELLKRAVSSQQVPATLERRVLTAIRSTHQQPAEQSLWWRWMVPSLAVAACGALAMVMLLPRSGTLGPGQSQEGYIASITSKVSTLMQVGLGDHIHCAVFRKFPKEPDPSEKMKRELGPEYFALMALVKENAPAGFRLQMAHRCRFQGRGFIHLVLKDKQRLMSVVVAPKQDRETFVADRLVPALSQSGITFYRQTAAEFQIAAFENESHLVYLISSESRDKNLQLMLAMARGINSVLPRS